MSKAKTKSTSKPKAAKAVKVSKPAKVKAETPAKIEREERNGVTRPGNETICGIVWSACAQLEGAGVKYTLEALREIIDDARGKRPAADNTLKTQRARWLKFHGAK